MKRFILILITVAALSLLGVATAGANASQNWYLNGSSPPPAAGQTMFRGDSTSPVGWVTIPAGASQLWLSDEMAQSDVTFRSGDGASWFVFLKTDDWKDYCRVEIGSTNGAGTFTKFATIQGTNSYIPDLLIDGWILQVEIELADATVDQGHYLALKVYNDSGDPHTITTTGGSYIVSPESDPGYPLPELAAGILLGAGLVGLGGFILVKRKKTSALSGR